MKEARVDVLAIGPHPDDVELCCGGTLAVLVDRGWRVGVVDLTRGELATNGTPETRAAEAARATEVLGLHHRENLGIPDGFVDPGGGYGDAWVDQGASTQVGLLVSALRRLQPDLVIAPWSRARHPDHAQASELVSRAVFFSGVGGFAKGSGLAPRRPRWLWWYPMRVEAPPSVVVDVTAAHRRKMEAIRCYASQVARADGEAAATLVNDPRNLRVVEARDRTFGAQIGVDFGEAFVSRATLGLADPLAFLRSADFDSPLLFPDRG